MTLDGRPRPDHGPGWRDRCCRDCSATWVGHERDGDWCPWCEKAAERQLADQRAMLLDPPWLHSDHGHHRYDELGDDDRAVWDRTRNQTRNTDSVETWIRRLGRAVQVGIITRAEADRAIDRLKQRDERSHGRRGGPSTTQ